jgi:hypothetical protein
VEAVTASATSATDSVSRAVRDDLLNMLDSAESV